MTSLVSVLTFISFILSELFLQWDADKVSIWDSATRLFEFLVALSVIVGSAIVCSVAIHYERRKNEASLKREVERELMKESMLYDELTGGLNRKALHEALKELEKKPPTAPLVFGIADIDHFKSVNDLYGHHVGDLCLVEFSASYANTSGIFRLSLWRDEFCLILPQHDAFRRGQLCERVLNRLRRAEFGGVPELQPTASFGLTILTIQDGASSLFNQADEALYEAKKVRNGIRAFRQSTANAQTEFA